MGDEKLSFSMRVTLAAAGVWGSCAALPALAGATYQPIRLGDFGPNPAGITATHPVAINAAGLVGGSAQYPPGGFSTLQHFGLPAVPCRSVWTISGPRQAVWR
jgi:hypothetical protein